MNLPRGEELMPPAAALARAIDSLGGQAALARLVGLRQPSVWRWVRTGKPLPGEHVLKVEAATGISRHDLRPDLYPREDQAITEPGLEAAR